MFGMLAAPSTRRFSVDGETQWRLEETSLMQITRTTILVSPDHVKICSRLQRRFGAGCWRHTDTILSSFCDIDLLTQAPVEVDKDPSGAPHVQRHTITFIVGDKPVSLSLGE